MFSGVLAATGSFAWILPYVRINNSVNGDNTITGATLGAYFAYGNGIPTTQEHPNDRVYGITKPRHLYNLAWLQYLGYFNETDGTQYYFELADDLNMEGWVLPPIGTEDHPFIGNFEGNGHVITGLTVSNDFSSYNTHPSAITEWNNTNRKQPHIVGLFGVIGDYNSDYSGTAYVSSKNEFKDTGITNFTIETVTQDTLVGIAAGYVDGPLSNIAIDSSSIDVTQSSSTSFGGHTTNISDFGVIGFATAAYKKSITKMDYDLYNVTVDSNKYQFDANDGGDAQGWGGSIDMKSMFQRLINIQNNGASNANYNYRTNTVTQASGSSTTTPYNYNTKQYRPNNTVGNFVYLNANSSYMYLAGGRRVVNDTYFYDDHSGYPISYTLDGTTYYLNLSSDGNSLTSGTDLATCTLWTFTGSGNTVSIGTNYGSKTLNKYLGRSGSTITLNASAVNEWTVTRNGNAMTIKHNNNNSRYILYSSGSWTLGSNDAVTYYYIHDSNNRYFNINNSLNGVTYTTTYVGATQWRLGNNTCYAVINGSNYYVSYDFSVSTSSTNSYYRRTVDNNNYLYVRYSYYGRYYYFYATWNGSQWTYTYNTTDSTARGNATILTFDEHSYTPGNLNNDTTLINRPDSGPGSYFDENDPECRESYMEYTATNTTYFPLNVVQDGGTSSSYITNGNYAPKDSNTGYVISGANIGNSTTISNGGPSLIRVSEYAISNISGSYTQGATTISDANVSTINLSGNTISMSASTNKEKYADSKATLIDKVLKNSSNVYGLHFMGAQISIDHTVEAANISILGTSYPTLEMPVNSIDFNLKEKGYINFFSGTYFSSDVTSFFSLHQILRNGDKSINIIKEISEIYGNDSKQNYSYVYKYTDGTYSKPYRIGSGNKKYEMSSDDTGTVIYDDKLIANYNLSETDFNTNYKTTYGYTKIFDTVQITNFKNGVQQETLTQNKLYYFEIPMNEGEFCLGSVDGGTGGYLIYLDIGANAMKVQRSIMYEHFITRTYTFSYPLGVAILDNGEYTGTVDPLNSACIIIGPNFMGVASVDRTGTSDLEVDRDDTTNAKIGYYIEDITVLHDPGGNDISNDVFASSVVTREYRRMNYFDYNVQLGEYVRTIITDVSVNGGAFTRESVEQYDQNGNPVETIKIYDSYSGGKIANDSSGKYATTILLPTEGQGQEGTIYSTSKQVTLRIVLKSTMTSTQTIDINVDIDTTKSGTNETYYLVDSYEITYTVTGETMTVYVKDYKTGLTIYVNDVEVTAKNQTITINL